MPAPAELAPAGPRVFVCKVCGWILGESYRDQARRITQLRIFRHPCEIGTPPMPVHAHLLRPQLIYAAVQVNDCTVLCEHCGAEVSWYANQNAIEIMIERRRKRERVIGFNQAESAT